MSFKSGVKGRGSDRWWERRWWLWWGHMCRMRWTRKRVNTMRLTEWRRELIPQVRWWGEVRHYKIQRNKRWRGESSGRYTKQTDRERESDGADVTWASKRNVVYVNYTVCYVMELCVSNTRRTGNCRWTNYAINYCHNCLQCKTILKLFL